MSDLKEIEIYVNLLEEGTPTWRPTQAVDLGNGLYKLLPTPDYDPEDEVWEFPPSSVVPARLMRSNKGVILLAVRPPVSREGLLKDYPNARLVEIYVHLNGKMDKTIKKTEAIDLGNRLYLLLPTPDYDPNVDVWEFSPGSIVKTVREKKDGGEILLAWDQIREDRQNEHYARYKNEG